MVIFHSYVSFREWDPLPLQEAAWKDSFQTWGGVKPWSIDQQETNIDIHHVRLREGLQIYPTYIVSSFMGEPTHRGPHDHQGHSYHSMIFSINQCSWLSKSIKHHYSSKILNKIISSPWLSINHHKSITIINLLVLNVGNEGMIHKNYQFHNPSNPHSHPFRTFSTSKSITIPSNNVIFHDFQYQSVFMNLMTIKFN